jgi:hypothetical protein
MREKNIDAAINPFAPPKLLSKPCWTNPLVITSSTGATTIITESKSTRSSKGEPAAKDASM